MPMRTLQEWMGHRDFATTLVYADYAPSEHEAEWIERAFARATDLRPENARLNEPTRGVPAPAVAVLDKTPSRRGL